MERQFEWRPNDTSIPAATRGYAQLFPRAPRTSAPAANHPTEQKAVASADDTDKGSLSIWEDSCGGVSTQHHSAEDYFLT